jgi:hypothetical protein
MTVASRILRKAAAARFPGYLESVAASGVGSARSSEWLLAPE